MWAQIKTFINMCPHRQLWFIMKLELKMEKSRII